METALQRLLIPMTVPAWPPQLCILEQSVERAGRLRERAEAMSYSTEAGMNSRTSAFEATTP